MLKSNVCELQRKKTSDKKVIRFHLGIIFYDPPCMNKHFWGIFENMGGITVVMPFDGEHKY